ncbi:MAG: hypothetical protein V4438_00280 [Patescibacteria group bacterium]
MAQAVNLDREGDEIDIQAIVEAQGSGLLGPWIRYGLGRKEWLIPEPVLFGTIEKLGHFDPVWTHDAPHVDTAALIMMDHAAFKIAIGPKEKVEILFFKAERLGVVNWHLQDLYGKKGEDRLALLGLSPCEADDAVYIYRMGALRSEDDALPTYVVHAPLHVSGFDRFFCVGFRAEGPRLEGASITEHNQVLPCSWIAVRSLEKA